MFILSISNGGRPSYLVYAGFNKLWWMHAYMTENNFLNAVLHKQSPAHFEMPHIIHVSTQLSEILIFRNKCGIN
jgi:hypothetical protein